MRVKSFRLEAAEITGGRQRWVMLGVFWLRLRRLRGRLAEHADAPEQRATHQVRLRYSRLVKPGMRFRKEERVLMIINVDDLGAHGKWLSCLCEERADASAEQGAT
jgi:SPP1 family predicted phage head-tail adaptor